VSWIVAPESYSEHPNWPADYGAWYVSQVLDILTANPDVWSKTVLLINYDEEGGFFDHMPPPVPPQTPAQGRLDRADHQRDLPGDGTHPAAPYGLGMRVPMLIVSPWSKGGWVDSQVFDHTSVIRFLEARFANGNPDLIEANITPWRRAVAGDLTSAFNFAKPNAKVPPLPSTDAYFPPDFERHDDYHRGAAGRREDAQAGEGPAPRPRAALCAAGAQRGAAGRWLGAAHLLERRCRHCGVPRAFGQHNHQPRTYTVEPGKELAGNWPVSAHGVSDYNLAVRGPNGFLRSFKGAVNEGRARLEVRARYDAHGEGITLDIRNVSGHTVEVRVHDRYTGGGVSCA
jgi:phospholipase C